MANLKIKKNLFCGGGIRSAELTLEINISEFKFKSYKIQLKLYEFKKITTQFLVSVIF